MSAYKFRPLQFEKYNFRSELNPHARSGHRMVADIDGNLYSFGGFNVQVAANEGHLQHDSAWQKYKPLFQELWKFDWRTKKWRRLFATGDMPEKLVSHCMCYWRDKIIVYGGTGLPYGENSSNKLSIYHIDRNHWEEIEPVSDPGKTPFEMYGQACALDNLRGDIYIIGGTNGNQYSLDVHKFNLFTKKWTPLYRSTELSSYDPGCRYRHEIALHNNKLYLFGGSTSTVYYGFEELTVFDLETRDWIRTKTKPDARGSKYPDARKCHSLAVIGDDCYICGGTNGEKVCSDIWHINLDELKWTLIVEHIPYPVYFHAATVSLGSKLNIFGGVENTTADTRNNHLTSIWLKIPSLFHMSLSAVTHFVDEGIIKPADAKSTGLVAIC